MFSNITWINNTSKRYSKKVNNDGTWVVTLQSPTGTPINVENLNLLKSDLDYLEIRTHTVKPQIARQIDELLYFVTNTNTIVNNKNILICQPGTTKIDVMSGKIENGRIYV